MDGLVEVYMGYEHTVKIVQLRLLEEANIQSLIKNELASGLMAGFGGGSLSSVSLFVKQEEAEKTIELLDSWEEEDS